MIGYLAGVIRSKVSPVVLLEVNGIGYEVQLPESSFERLPELGEELQMYTHVQVRDDSHALFGFLQQFERDIFRILLKIQGIGPRSAISILSELTLEDIVACARLNDPKVLEKVPGIGAKTAKRLIIDLRDKVSEFPEFFATDGVGDVSGDSVADNIRDVVDALAALGFTKREANAAVETVRGETQSTDELLRLALASLGPR